MAIIRFSRKLLTQNLSARLSPTIMEKVALLPIVRLFSAAHEYYQRVFIKSSKEEKKLNSAPLVVRFLL